VFARDEVEALYAYLSARANRLNAAD